MATQGLVTVTSGGKVLMKVVCGCDGYNALRVSKALVSKWPVSPIEAYKIAKEEGFGCGSCLMVVTDSGIFGKSEDSFEIVNLEGEDFDNPLYREKFSEPRFNPRWELGTADYVRVIGV